MRPRTLAARLPWRSTTNWGRYAGRATTSTKRSTPPQAPTDADLLSVLIDDALKGDNPTVKVALYTAPDDLDPFSEEAIKAANPAYGDFLNADECRRQAD